MPTLISYGRQNGTRLPASNVDEKELIMGFHPLAIREAVFERIRCGTSYNDVIADYGISRRTAERWLSRLRAAGENVSYLRNSERAKARALSLFEKGATIEAVSSKTHVSEITLRRWRDGVEPPGKDTYDLHASGALVKDVGETPWLPVARRKLGESPKDVVIRELQKLLSEKTMELDFFRGALREVEARRRQNTGSGEKGSTRQ
jgi:hypothetical protein